MKKTGILAFGCSLLVAGAVRATMTVDVASGTDRTITADEAAALIASDEDLVKTGDGRFIIDRSMAGYGGKIEIREGYLRCTKSYALGDGGTKGKPTVVSDGATLEFGSSETLYLSPEKKDGFKEVQVEGEGVNGCGALCHVGSTKDQYYRVFAKVVLNGDTTFGGVPNAKGDYYRFDIRGTQGSLDLQGHTLTIKGCFGLTGVDVTPGETGRIVVDGDHAAFIYENGSVNFNGSAANVIELKNGAAFRSQAGGPAIAWSLVADNGTFQDTNASDGITRGRINGPVTVKSGGLTLKSSSKTGHVTLGGKISGPGRITMTATQAGVVFSLLDPTSDWTGGLSIGTGNSPCAFMHALPNATTDGIYSIGANATLNYVLPASDPTGAALAAFTNVVAHNTLSGLFQAHVADGDSALNGLDIAEGTRVVRYGGDGELVLNGNQNGARLYVLGGSAEVTGIDKTHVFDDINVGGDATLRLRDAGSVWTSTNHVSVGATYPAVARLTVENTLFVTNWGRWANRTYINPIEVGPTRLATVDGYSISSYGKSRGILEVGPGAVLTNTFWVGRMNESSETKKTGHGSIFVRGGRLTAISPDPYSFVGYAGSGYYEQTSGLSDFKGLVYPGAGQRGRGEIKIAGGTLVIEGANLVFGQYSRTANPGMGVYYQTGGEVSSQGAIIMGKTLYDSSNAGSRDQLTVAGGRLFIEGGFDLGGEPDSVSIANLNGGEFRCHYMQIITNELQTLIGNGANKTIANSHGYVNFDGGTFRYGRIRSGSSRPGYKEGGFFFGDPERIRITSYGKGATFDTDGYTVTNRHAITGPTGQGIVSIALPQDYDLPDWAYAGAPIVEIAGDGTGASAVAEFDSTNGRVTGITVTSPGCDYTTATAKMVRGGFTNDVDLVVTLGAPVSGGLTKAGEGTLRMESANTYGGVTRVEKGTLLAANADAIPAGNGLEVFGGVLDAGGYEKDYGAITAASGTLRNASGTFASFQKTGPGSFVFDAPLSSTADLDVREGTLVLPVARPGLNFGEKIYPEGATTPEYTNRQALPGTEVELSPSRAYEPCVTDGYYKPRHYVSYSGYVWNRGNSDVTWTFGFAFDDNLEIRIDGKNLAATKHGTASWGALYTADVTLTPGPHAFQLVLWNAQGNGGAMTSGNVSGVVNWRNDIIGLAYDPQGRGSTDGNDYVHMTDPGDGSLFTTTPYDLSEMPTFGSLKMAPGTGLDVNDGIYAFGGDLHVSTEAVKNPIRVSGGIDFDEEASVTVDGLDVLSKDAAPYTILTTTRGISGKLPTLDGGWRLRRRNGGKELQLDVERGALLLVR